MSTQLLIPVEPPPQSKTQQLAKLLPGVEAALAQGHSHEVIHEHIKNTIGLDLTFKYYKTTLHRLRKQRDQAKQAGMARPALLPYARVAAPGQGSAQDASVPSQPGPRFTYDVKSPIDEFF